MSAINFTANYIRDLKTAAIVLAVGLTSGMATNALRAQSINDDLKPKPAAVKPKPATKTPAKAPVKTPAKTVKKTVSRSSSERKSSVAKTNPQNNVPTETYVAETADQILNRFMNFQQSAGVTVRDWNNVLAQTAKTLKDNPNHSIAKAQSLIAQGQIAYSQRGYAMAMTHFKAALQILPTSSLPHYTLGMTYLANGQAAAAERSFKRAIEQNKKFALAYKGLGDAFAAQGEKETAEKYFRRATEISVKDGNMNP